MDGLNKAKGFAEAGMNSVENGVNSALNTVEGGFNSAINEMDKGFNSTIDTIEKGATGVMNEIADGTMGVFDDMEAGVMGAFNQAAGGLNSALDFVKNIPNMIPVPKQSKRNNKKSSMPPIEEQKPELTPAIPGTEIDMDKLNEQAANSGVNTNPQEKFSNISDVNQIPKTQDSYSVIVNNKVVPINQIKRRRRKSEYYLNTDNLVLIFFILVLIYIYIKVCLKKKF